MKPWNILRNISNLPRVVLLLNMYVCRQGRIVGVFFNLLGAHKNLGCPFGHPKILTRFSSWWPNGHPKLRVGPMGTPNQVAQLAQWAPKLHNFHQINWRYSKNFARFARSLIPSLHALLWAQVFYDYGESCNACLKYWYSD